MNAAGKIGIVINARHGGFGVSAEGKMALAKRGVTNAFPSRTCKELIDLIQTDRICMSQKFGWLVVKWIDEKYFEYPGFWKIKQLQDGREFIEVDETGYEIFKQNQYLQEFHKDVTKILHDEHLNNEQKVAMIENFRSGSHTLPLFHCLSTLGT
jgi:hypothetical protein